MTFNAEKYSPVENPDHSSPCGLESHAGPPPSSTREHNDPSSNSRGHCIARWEDEGGTITSPKVLAPESPIQSYITKAADLLNDGQVSCAVDELTLAAERLKTYNVLVNESITHTIGQLSTVGCQASAPHPKTLDLIRLRQQL